METSTIIKYLEPIAQYYDPSMMDHLEAIAVHVTPRKFKAGECIPQPGQSDFTAACVVEGVFRTISIDSTKHEHTVRFAAEGDFSMYIQELKVVGSSLEYRWEAVTDSVMLTWERNGLEMLAKTIPNWYFVSLKILQTIILRLTVERGEMFSDDATTRYLKFAARYPHIIARVPLRHVADYLGIAPQSLSRIRQQVAKSLIN